MTKRVATLALIILLAGATPGSAQESEPPVARDRTGAMVVAGVLGGTIGLVAGGAAGMTLERSTTQYCTDFCGLLGALVGGVVGESLGMAAGVHLANDRQGTFAGTYAGPLAIGGAAFLFALSGGADNIPAPAVVIGVVVPTAQLAAAIAGQKASARRR